VQDRTPALADLAADLASGRTTSRALTESCLERIADPAGEGGRAFTMVFRAGALDAARASDRRRADGAVIGPLDGIPISLKDLFDVAGTVTRAGSPTLADAAPAVSDAAIVARLKAAGAVIVGKTNMTEFAYSGLGLNPHYGTPGNPWDKARIPGGSSSGAGVAGPYGFAAASIGTDTGGSVRIPAAFCGVVGFKPTSRRIPLDGTFPLSRSLDSIGPLARSVACCALLDAVMAGAAPRRIALPPLAGRRFLVPAGSMLTEDLDRAVAAAFDRALGLLSQGGAELVHATLPALELARAVNRLGGVAAPEAFAVHRARLASHGDRYDPRVRRRLEAAAHGLAADYIEALSARAAAIAGFDAATRGFDAMLCPTVAVVAPRFDRVADDAAFAAANSLVLRNTSIFNMLDRSALSLPIQRAGDLPVGLMVVGETLGDQRLLAIGAAIEHALRREDTR
jgi:aspartyl-tRNA(Asn)/glutamyl-tRNA(Gln) amidotransferase subunit A